MIRIDSVYEASSAERLTLFLLVLLGSRSEATTTPFLGKRRGCSLGSRGKASRTGPSWTSHHLPSPRRGRCSCWFQKRSLLLDTRMGTTWTDIRRHSLRCSRSSGFFLRTFYYF
jgi:hypothetical protein